jgi:Ca-activated chloride channel homolog
MNHKLLATSVFILVSFASLSLERGRAQNSATVFGTVLDPAGAVVANAKVELKSDATGSTLSAVADSSGRYSFVGLGAGKYELRVTVPGFKVYIAIIRLESATDRRELPVVLQVGASAESVTVSAAAGYPLQTRVRIPAHGVRLRNAPRNTEQYDFFVENEFSLTKSNPLSTFSTDVDTASYANVRRFLKSGQTPPPGSIRIEELVNYFTYDYPVPEEGKPISVTTHLTASPWNRGRQLLHIGLRTRPIAAENLPPSRLTFLIDVSGSMQGPLRLPLVKASLGMLVEQLRPQDSVALVVYAGAAGVVLEPTSGNEKAKILDAIGALEAGGSTHGSAGIRSAYEMARRAFLRNGNNRVILATDGDFNVGVSNDDELVRLIETERESGVFLSVLGFGMGNLKDSKMEKLADHGNGNYAYIDSAAEARKVLVEQMGATLMTVAKDVKLQIEFNPARVKSWRLIGYENRVLRPEEFNDDKKDAGDLGAGHQVTAFYELIPAGSVEETGDVDQLRYQKDADNTRKARSNELAWLKLRHKKPQARKSELLEWPIASEATRFSSLPNDVRFAAAVAEYGILLRRSKFEGHANFDHVIAAAQLAIRTSTDEHKLEFLDLAKLARTLTSIPE